MNETLLMVFIAVTALAVLMQAVLMAALYGSAKKAVAQLDAMSHVVNDKVLPTLTEAQEMLAETRPKLREILENTTATSVMVREQTERLNVTLSDALDRTRLQVIRADEIVSRTMDRVEETTEAVHNVVLSPVRQVSAMMTGLMAGIGEYIGGRKVRRQEQAVPRDEMFI